MAVERQLQVVLAPPLAVPQHGPCGGERAKASVRAVVPVRVELERQR
jgi:hypothetical protein